MSENQEPQSGRARERTTAKTRRATRLAWSQNSFDLLASGFSPEQIAEARKVSIRTIRREIDAAIARRQLDSPERYVHLQVARLTKALRLTDVSIERGDLKAVPALVQVISAMDRYHGLARALNDRANAAAPGAFALEATTPPAPPLKLFHAGLSEANTHESETEMVT